MTLKECRQAASIHNIIAAITCFLDNNNQVSWPAGMRSLGRGLEQRNATTTCAVLGRRRLDCKQAEVHALHVPLKKDDGQQKSNRGWIYLCFPHGLICQAVVFTGESFRPDNVREKATCAGIFQTFSNSTSMDGLWATQW